MTDTRTPPRRLRPSRVVVGLLMACGVALVLSVAVGSVGIAQAEVVSAITRHVVPWTLDGSTIALAAAGLLDGRRATSHWSMRHLLAGYGAVESDQRVVQDGNRITAAGITAGMDLALRLVAQMCGEPLARFAMLGAEYAPEPPFRSGTPAEAGSELTDLSRDFLAPMEVELSAAANPR